MNVPDIWGQGGALFAFSGMDGPTDWYHPFVGSTSYEGRGITFHTETPASISLRLEGESLFHDEAVSGDVISTLVTHGSGVIRLRYIFLDKDTVVGDISAQRADAPIACGINLDAPESQAEVEGNVLTLRGGVETFHLAAEGAALSVDEKGFSASLSAGDVVRFALRYSFGSVPDSSDRLSEVLSVDREKLYAERLSFFDCLPEHPTSDGLLSLTYRKCASVQKVNCMTAQDQIEFDWTTPDRFPHRHLWIWDSAFHALGLRHFAPEWAKNAVKSVLSKQRPDGFIPHMMTPDGVHDSDIIQPPIMAWGTWRVHEAAPDLDFLKYCYPRLKAMILYNCREKDRDGNGLAEWEEGGSSGMDNSPRFDQPWGDSVDLNSYLVNDMLYLAEMARLLGISDDVEMWTRLRGERGKKINDLMWDDATGFYYDLDPQGRRIMLKTEAGFTPLFAGICSEEQAASLVKHLESPDEFWRAFPLPSVSADEPTFSDDMWRGPVWINFNCFLIEALRRYGYDDTAAKLRDTTLREIARWYQSDGVIYEFYDSEGHRSPSILNRKGDKGIPFGRWHIGRCIRDYHFTAAIFVDLLMCDGTQL